MMRFFSDTRNKNFVRLWWAQLVSQFGDRINQMALIGLSYELSGQQPSASGLAKLLSFTIIPVFIVGPVAGVFVDRWDRRKTLLICDIARGVLVLTIPLVFFFWKTMIPIYCVVFLAFCFSRFSVPAKMSLIPEIVPEDNLLMANSMITTTGMIAFALGCAAGGFLVEWFGARGGFFTDSATFFISAALILTMRRDLNFKLDRRALIDEGKEILKVERSFWQELREGVVYLFKKREIRLIIAILFILLAAAGSVYVTIIVFIQEIFQSVTRHLGVLAVTLGVGLFLGTVAYGRLGKKIPWHRTVFLCLLLSGMMMICFVVGISHFANVWLAFILTLSLGVVTGPVFIVSNMIVHRVADEQMHGKVFSSLEIVIHLGFMLAMLTSSFLTEFFSAGAILSCAGLVVCVIGASGLLWYKDTQCLCEKE